MVLREIFGGELGKLTREWRKSHMSFRRMRFVGQVRRFGDIKIIDKIFVRKSASVCSCKLYE